MADAERNARLAKWVGWEPRLLCGPEAHLDVAREHGDYLECKDGWQSCPGVLTEEPPAYDTDPAAALELLGWLAEKGWRPYMKFIDKGITVGFHPPPDSRIYPYCVSGHAKGPPLVALPEAIAEVAEAVRKLEEGK